MILLPIGYAFYEDYREGPAEFWDLHRDRIKKFGKWVILIILIQVISVVEKRYLPLDSNHGLEYNSTRSEIGLPLIGEDWHINKAHSNQYHIEYRNGNKKSDHIKKILKYKPWGLISETDYYLDRNTKSYFWKTYEVSSQEFYYYMEVDLRHVDLPKKALPKAKGPFEIKISEEHFDMLLEQLTL